MSEGMPATLSEESISTESKSASEEKKHSNTIVALPVSPRDLPLEYPQSTYSVPDSSFSFFINFTRNLNS